MDGCNTSVYFPDCEDYSEIILSITFFASFIVIFFFTYGLYMEKTILNNELSGVMDSVLKQIGRAHV